MAGSYTLSITTPQGTRTQSFTQPRLVLGREVGDIVLNDPLSSSTHAEIVFANGQVTLRDLGSTNGTYVNGQRITEVVLTPGVIVQFGNSHVQVVAGEDQRGRTMVAGTAMRPPTQPPAQAGYPPLGTQPPQQQPAQAAAKSGGGGMKLALILGGLAVAGCLTCTAGYFLFRSKYTTVEVTRPGPNGTTITTPLTKKPVVSKAVGGVSATREATVKAVWFAKRGEGDVLGGTSDIVLRISPNAKGAVSVGVMEEFAGGTGNQWRTATWLAAFTASQVTGSSLAANEFLVRAGGHIDGPSAGMLMTATMTALLKGVTPRADTTMTGTINPDGSAGPVGGIVQKMEGAKASGIKRFGFPVGARSTQDMRTGEMADLLDVAKRQGLEAKEIHDIYEAYEWLTGEKLERSSPVDEAEMDVDTATQAKLRGLIGTWKRRVEGDAKQVGALAKKLGKAASFAAPALNEAEAMIKRAENYEQSDQLVAAHTTWVKAALSVALAKELLVFMPAAVQQDIGALAAQIEDAAKVKVEVDAFAQRTEFANVQTAGGQVSAIRAWQAYVTAASFLALGDSGQANAQAVLTKLKKGELQVNQETLKYLFTNMLKPIIYYRSARVMLDFATDQQQLVGEEGKVEGSDQGAVSSQATAYTSAAGAVLAYFDSLVTEQAATDQDVAKSTMVERIAQNETGYLIGLKAKGLAEGLPANGEQGQTLMRLAAGSLAYLQGASLVNKYYSLAGNTDENGKLTLRNRKALSTQLDLARVHAREAAAKAKAAVGFVPGAARLEYMHGNALREGDDEDKLQALSSYWGSAFWSEMVALPSSK